MHKPEHVTSPPITRDKCHQNSTNKGQGFVRDSPILISAWNFKQTKCLQNRH